MFKVDRSPNAGFSRDILPIGTLHRCASIHTSGLYYWEGLSSY